MIETMLGYRAGRPARPQAARFSAYPNALACERTVKAGRSSSIPLGTILDQQPVVELWQGVSIVGESDYDRRR